MKKLRKITALLCTIIIMLSLCACEGFEPVEEHIDGKSAGKNLGVISAADDVFTLNCSKGYSFNPLVATNTNNQLVCDLVYENIVELDNNYNVLPNLATSWETSDGGQRWTFHVGAERYFHDGTKMTAYDIAYSVKCATGSDRFKYRFGYVYGCSALDEETFIVTLAKQNMLFPMLMCIPVIQNGSFQNEYPGGTGPYTYAPDYNSLIAFDKYPNYQNLPVDTVYLDEYEGGIDTIDAFEDSLIDVAMNDPTAPTNLGYGMANEIRGFNTANLHFIGFNVYSSTFSTEMMRVAMNFAFDREAMKTQLGGYADPTAIPLSPSCAWYDEELNKQYSYNLEACKNIFESIGLEDMDDDGFLEMKYGDSFKEISIRFVVCSDSSVKLNIARKFAEDMESLGIQVNLIEYAWKAYKEAVEAGNFDMFYGETRLNPDFDVTRIIGTGGSLNFGQLASEEVDTAIAEYLAADDEHRTEAASSMCSKLCSGGYLVSLGFEKHQMITHRGAIIGIKVCENNPMMNVANWQISFTTMEDEEKNEGN